jgi:hypothetical protein
VCIAQMHRARQRYERVGEVGEPLRTTDQCLVMVSTQLHRRSTLTHGTTHVFPVLLEKQVLDGWRRPPEQAHERLRMFPTFNRCNRM